MLARYLTERFRDPRKIESEAFLEVNAKRSQDAGEPSYRNIQRVLSVR